MDQRLLESFSVLITKSVIQSAAVTFEQLGRVFSQVTFFQLMFQCDNILKGQLFQMLAM